jgi:general secretion pathway protein G
MNRTRRSGFTLIEIMIVIVIIVALGGLVSVAIFSRKDDADAKLAEIQLNTMKNAVKQFRLDFNRWPTEEEGLEVLWSVDALDADADETKWSKYLEEPLPTDQWGNEWGYRDIGEYDETMFEIWSNGPDGEEDTEDDIRSWRGGDDDGYGEPLMPDDGGP